MKNAENRDEQPQQQAPQDESVQDFKEDHENDPSTAAPGEDEALERLRGG